MTELEDGGTDDTELELLRGSDDEDAVDEEESLEELLSLDDDEEEEDTDDELAGHSGTTWTPGHAG